MHREVGRMALSENGCSAKLPYSVLHALVCIHQVCVCVYAQLSAFLFASNMCIEFRLTTQSMMANSISNAKQTIADICSNFNMYTTTHTLNKQSTYNLCGHTEWVRLAAYAWNSSVLGLTMTVCCLLAGCCSMSLALQTLSIAYEFTQTWHNIDFVALFRFPFRWVFLSTFARKKKMIFELRCKLWMRVCVSEFKWMRLLRFSYSSNRYLREDM